MTQIKERPILFSAPMVRAILEGRKTVTRREVKKQAALDCLAAGFEPSFLTLPGNADLCPYGRAGDRLWVRETWAADAQVDSIAPRDLSQGEPILYPADCAVRQTGCSMITQGRGRPSIHMPRWASRILLEIADVRVERLQDITYEQAVAEGVHRDRGCRVWTATDEDGTCHKYPIPAFKDLWTGINGPQAWESNPWVWVVEFKRVTP
ncbi:MULTISPECIES: hypothetical protein [unclassified Pseudomonas]|uniref:hypothetical protein n=1 Tax=unclassified Pseudomonas TaxID=196821 RepID=UPI000D34CAB6|nr:MULTISPECIES: hypothetical protein [unclassified Pseudomonas]RAU43476.1 hypothetical protein DBP26_019970 [Pseudomonas sp. RIT 409]RAU49987.1 hypothetical protein DBY65_022815 [Pseudomonas sp. RIT 412]